ncbi:uncharacterized protein LOC130736706 [Lotus japonicus]|uniref:uncharacterized protein LOC130736706 n=1 Tax=Lotus japonicus TaxID=34305 RepID=UPI00258AC603|nr:uncharacterized protein LOC130736706 [Lotus japonicus]
MDPEGREYHRKISVAVREEINCNWADREIWKVKNGVEIREVGSNLYVFRFFSEKDREGVLKQGPWNFDKSLVVLQILDPDSIPAEVPLVRAAFWVRVHDLPLGLRKEAVAVSIGDFLGGFIGWDRSNDRRLGPFLRVRARVNIQVPIWRGTLIARSGKDPVKVWFQYERLGNFCYSCGAFDHVLKDCDDFAGDEAEDEVHDFPFGSWLCAPPLRPNVVSGVRGMPSNSGVKVVLVHGAEEEKDPEVVEDVILVPESRMGGKHSELVDSLVSGLSKVNVVQNADMLAVATAIAEDKENARLLESPRVIPQRGNGLVLADVENTLQFVESSKKIETQVKTIVSKVVSKEKKVVKRGNPGGKKWKKAARGGGSSCSEGEEGGSCL